MTRAIRIWAAIVVGFGGAVLAICSNHRKQARRRFSSSGSPVHVGVGLIRTGSRYGALIDSSTKKIPVVTFTSSAGKRDIVESCRLGVDRHLVKPSQFYKFRQGIAKVGLYWTFMDRVPS